MKKHLLLLSLFSFTIMNAQENNVGINTTIPGSTLTINGSFAAKYKNVSSNAYTMLNTDYYVAWSGTTTGTITLPSTSSASPSIGGRQYHIKNTGNEVLTIVPTGTELIDNQTGPGVSSITLAPGEYAMIIAKNTVSGTTWEIVIVGKAVYQEPWYAQTTNVPATDNTQNIYQTGNVGIKTKTPRTALDVTGPIMTTAGNFPYTINATAIGYNIIEPGIGVSEFINYRGTGNGGFKFYSIPNHGTPQVTDRIAFLNINGVWTATNYNTGSDARLKRNIKPVENGLEIISQLKPVTYDKRMNLNSTNYDRKEIGFIAQELKKVLPNIVAESEDSDKVLSVSYNEIIPVLTKAIQELTERVEKLEQENKTLLDKVKK